MKTLTKVLATAVISIATVASANAANFKASNESNITNLCMVAAQGTRIEMNKAIKESGFSKSYIYENVNCNNQHITDFALDNNPTPDKVAALLMQGQRKGSVSINDIAKL
ncbi:DUF3718 domain-containing protein [Thalassotalea ganghwensis]